jgi:ion channel-forming bestrophin family protein
MIVTREPLTWLGLILRLQGTALVRIKWRLFAVFVLASVLTAYEQLTEQKLALSHTPFSLVGLALSIFLGFRNAASYDRFWEGRKFWGLMVNTSRSYARQVITLVGLTADPQDGAVHSDVRKLHEDLIKRMIAYVHSVRQHLRGGADLETLAELLPANERPLLQRDPNPPMAILASIAEKLAEAQRRGWLHFYQLNAIDETLSKFSDIQGGCERIKNTPVPFSYTVEIHRIVGVYCCTLPFALFDSMGVFTPLVTVLVGYAFLAIDALGDELEDPFGTDPNDLPLSALCTTIERDLKARIGFALPAAATPVDEVLS